ncbi:Serine/threonine-protein kinase HT1 [Hordeum vulgare]|nr:Serine/threonine-protein kinase HT1 [Hordeum vulgare]
MERLRLARRFGGTVKSCLADRCYAESCLVGRCYARQFFQNLRVWANERRAVALFGVVVASIILHGAFDGDVKSILAGRCYAVSCLKSPASYAQEMLSSTAYARSAVNHHKTAGHLSN